MALSKCEDCGKDVSTKASFCPNCGCPVEPEKSTFQKQYEEWSRKEKLKPDYKPVRKTPFRAKMPPPRKPLKRLVVVTLVVGFCCWGGLFLGEGEFKLQLLFPSLIIGFFLGVGVAVHALLFPYKAGGGSPNNNNFYRRLSVGQRMRQQESFNETNEHLGDMNDKFDMM